MLLQEVTLDPISNLLGYASGFAAVTALGVVKKYTTILDSAIGKKLKPVQPWIAVAGSMLIPLLAGKIGIQVDPQQFLAAPAATAVAIGAAEVISRLQKKGQ